MALFESTAGDSIQRDILRLKEQDRTKLREEHRLSIDYLKNRQVADVEQQLLERFPASQYADSGQEIYPATLPLTERYVAEAANAYNGTVRRYFVDDEGNETDATKEQTLKLNKALEKARYDEIMHACERYTVLLKMCCVWFQRKRFQLKPVLAFPYQVYPITPDSPLDFDQTDPDDYTGFVVENEWAKEDPLKAVGSVYAYIKPEETIYYTGYGPGKIDDVLRRAPNPFRWEQVDESDSGEKIVSVRPGRMLTFWHETLNVDELIPFADATIARANRELNIAWSMVLDTIRFQSFATPVKKLINPDQAGAKQRHGARFPVVVTAPIEDFRYEKADAPYTETVAALDHFAKFLASLKRQSPNDFSIEGAKAISGFAKEIESLPKIEARNERIRALLYLEEHEAGPRMVSILISTEDLDPVAAKMRLKVRFADVEFPQTAQEEKMRLDMRLQHNMTTAAKVLAEETGISVEEAEAEIEANAEKNREMKRRNPEQSNGAGFANGAFSQLIAKKKGAQGARPTSQEDRPERKPSREGDRDDEEDRQGSPD